MSTSTGADSLVEVTLLRLPLGIYREAAEHTDELQREFALLLGGDADDRASVPARLLDLVQALDARFGAFTSEPTSALQEALARRDQHIDVTYRVPVEVKEAAVTLSALLDEADAFCRAGEHLLTLATPAGPLAFRRWFLGEFVNQVDGAPPVPWDESAEARFLEQRV